MTDTALAAFAASLGAASTPQAAFAALHAYSDATTGGRLFTVMTVDMGAGLARRAYTSDPVSYPASGTKPVQHNAWFDVVHGRHETFVANTLADIAQVFPDHALIGSLGCGSVVNLPILRAGSLIATVNVLDAEHYWTGPRVAGLQAQMPVPAMAALAVHDMLARS